MDNIGNELKSLDVKLLEIGIQTPYTVAHDYFDNFIAELPILLSQDSMHQESQIPKAMADNQNFSVPEGYFDQFASSLLQKIKTSASADEPQLPQIAMPFDAPTANYFEQFNQQLLQQIAQNENVETAITLSFGKIDTPYQVPNDYFASVTNEVVAKAIDAQEAIILSEATILASIGKTMPYEVPQGYFEQDLTPQVAPNVVAFKPKKQSKWRTWSAAAAVALMFSFGANYVVNSFNGAIQEQDLQALMVNITAESIDEYINMNLEDFESTAMASGDHVQKVKAEAEIQALINNVSQDELDQYFNIID